MFYRFAVIDDHGNHQDNTAWTLDQWRHLVAWHEATDALHQAMRIAPLPWGHGHQNRCWFGYIFSHCRLQNNQLILYVYNLAKSLQSCPCPTPSPRLSWAGLGGTMKFMPPDGETDHHGGGVCVVCCVVDSYYSYVDKSMRWEFFAPNQLILFKQLKC